MADVEICGVSKTFGKDGGGKNTVHALKDVSLRIPDGSFTTILGPSGCGKSTLLRIIAGLESPSDGTVRIGGKDVTRLPPGKRRISMVFQALALYPHMNVYKNMEFSLKAEGLPKAEIESRIEETARYLEIEDLLERRPDTLSGGQKQRVAIGRAIVRRPEVFLFDEALSNLDEKLKESMRSLLSEMHRSLGRTLIYVTHDQKEALSLSDQVLLMKGGEVQQVASPQVLYEDPVNMFAASFIGSPSINYFSCKELVDILHYTEFGTLRMKASRISESSGDFQSSGLCNSSPARDGAEKTEIETLCAGITAALRPEHFVLSQSETSGGVEAVVDSVSYSGSVVHVAVWSVGVRIVVTLKSAEAPLRGERIWLVPDFSRLMFFDKRTGLRI